MLRVVRVIFLEMFEMRGKPKPELLGIV